MSEEYFKLLIETERTCRLTERLIKEYALENRIPCNVMQILTLHFLIKLGGSGSPHEVHKDITGIGGVTKNNHYNFQNLIKNGYLIHKKGKSLGMDNRCVFLEVTSKGRDLYKKVCIFLDEKIQELRKELGWEDENFSDYFADLTALQEVMSSK